tara:strand:+ start:965 stop:2200 length:1236 start_codon:yes stop_codon:yes gene_type:complete
MARNRIIYQSESLYAGPAPATGFHLVTGTSTLAKGFPTTAGVSVRSRVNQIQRVQTANYSFNIARQDVNQFGELAAIDRVILESPTVSLDFSYILGSLINESNLGFTITKSGDTNVSSAMAGILNKTEDERNYFIKTVAEGVDALGDSPTAAGVSAAPSVIGIGNAFITSYSTEGAVGDFPTASVSVEALNMDFVPGVSGNHIPAVTPADGSKITDNFYALPSGTSNAGGMKADATAGGTAGIGTSGVSALRPGDISLAFYPNGADSELVGFTGVSITDAKIQSYTLSFDLARDPLQKLGSKFAFAREITFPVTVSLSVDANLGDLTTGALADVIDQDSNYDVNVVLHAPGAGTSDPNRAMARYVLKKCKVDSQEYSSDIGSNKSVSLGFSAQIGGPAQTDVGLFMSGVIS